MEKDCQYLSWENAPIGPLLGHAAHLARERMDARLSRYDMTPSQTHTLLYLSSHGYTAPQRDVVEHLRVRPSTANGILDRMEEKGLIRLISTTNFNAVELRKLIDAGIPVATNQCQYSVLDRRPAMRLERLCRETGVKLLCYGTVAGGFMSEKWLGAPKPDHFENRSLVKYALVIEDSLRWEGFQALLALMKEIGDPLGLSIANVSTLWTLSRPEVAAAIIGTRSSRHVDGNAALIGRTLPPEGVARIDAFLAGFPTVDGDCFDLERLDGSKHRAIMRMNLVNSVDGK